MQSEAQPCRGLPFGCVLRRTPKTSRPSKNRSMSVARLALITTARAPAREALGGVLRDRDRGSIAPPVSTAVSRRFGVMTVAGEELARDRVDRGVFSSASQLLATSTEHTRRVQLFAAMSFDTALIAPDPSIPVSSRRGDVPTGGHLVRRATARFKRPVHARVSAGDGRTALMQYTRHETHSSPRRPARHRSRPGDRKRGVIRGCSCGKRRRAKCIGAGEGVHFYNLGRTAPQVTPL